MATQTLDDPSSRAMVGDPRLVSTVFGSTAGLLASQSIPPTLPAIGTALAVPDFRVGLVMSVFLLPTAVMVPVLGALADRYGRRPVFLGSLLAFGVSGVAVVWVNDFTVLLGLRVVQGAAYAGITPLSIAVIGDIYDGAAGATAQGFRVGAHGFGNTLAPAIAGLLAGMSWHYPFLLFGLAFPACALAYVFLPETVPESESESGSEGLSTYVTTILTELRDPSLSVLVFGVGVLFFVKYAVLTFVPLFAVRVLDASSLVSGLLLSVFGVARILAVTFLGTVTSRFSRSYTFFAAVCAIALGIGFIALSTREYMVVGAIAFFSLGDAIALPFIHDLVSAMPASDSRAGVVSVMNVAKMGAAALSPAAFGALLAFTDFVTVFLVAAGLAACYAVVAVLVIGLDPAAFDVS